MELRTLRYFVAAADAGSVNAAAPLLHVTQPAISRQLTHLQTELGVALFDTRGGRSTLTAAGRQFLPIARDLLLRADQARAAAASFAAGRLQSMTISAPATTVSDVIAPFLATWGAHDPMPHVVEAATSDASSALLSGADLAIVTEDPGAHRSRVAIADLPVWAYVRADHRWAARGAVEVSELGGEDVIAMTPRFTPRRILDSALAAAGVPVPDLIECGDARVAQALAAAGRGVAIVSDDPRFDLVPLHLHHDRAAVRLRLFAAWDPAHHARDTLAEVGRRLADFCVQRYGPGVRPAEHR